ncbi:BglG family transcription antiterminator LicT [Carnobacterium maltaromaticum]|uniref:BglG family transcription antiterminator LicT n=1 Tax=Carnobacterium maltaromaticum TaxID=2751 RepID=UPI003B986E1C
MNIHKILNNNVLIAIDDNGIEQVMMGKGIGFKQNAGDPVDITRADKIFHLENNGLKQHFNSLIDEVPYLILKVTEEFIDISKQRLKQKLNESLHVSLVDHIYHALKRHENEQTISNSLVWEINRLYPAEFGLAKEFLTMIQTEIAIELPIDEAGFIAMHLINAELNEEMNATVASTKEVAAILKIVKYHLGVEFDEESLNFYRFLTHLRFFVQRVSKNHLLENEDPELYLMMKKKYPQAYTCTTKIAKYIYATFHIDLTSEEMLYLLIHLKRLKIRDKALTNKD